LIENEAIMFPPPQLSRSKSATTLKLNCLDTNEEQMNAFSQLLAISIALMESHVDNEFLLGLNLFDKVVFPINSTHIVEIFLSTTDLFIESGNVYIKTKRNVDIAFLMHGRMVGKSGSVSTS
jgi:hypothetical protein